MKTVSTFLWQLIHSMTTNEKLFFKRNFAGSINKEKPIYLLLFDAIATQKKYNEELILKKFKPTLNTKNIAYQKHYLQQQICTSIAEYDNRENASHTIYKQVLLIRVYRKKGLFDEAFAVWEKAVNAARSIEAFAQINLLKTEFEKIILLSNAHKSYDNLHSVFQANVITYSEYKEMITLRDIYTEVLLLKRKAHFDLDNNLRKRVEELVISINKIHTRPENKSFWYKHYHSTAKATLFYLLHRHNESFELLKSTWSEWKKNKHFVYSDSEFYIELLYMINYTGIFIGEYEYVMTVFNDSINNEIKDRVQIANFETNKFLAFNKIYNKTVQYDAVEKLCNTMAQDYPLWEPYLNTDLNRTTNISMGISFFVLDKHIEAFYYIKRSLIDYKDGTREEQIAISNIFLLVITYCMNHPKLFGAQYRSTYQYFYKKEKTQPFETALIQCLNRTFYMQEMKAKAAEYKKALAVFDNNKENFIQQQMLSIFNYYRWLKSRYLRVSYRKYVTQEVKGK